jgi:hypothetical protein
MVIVPLRLLIIWPAGLALLADGPLALDGRSVLAGAAELAEVLGAIGLVETVGAAGLAEAAGDAAGLATLALGEKRRLRMAMTASLLRSDIGTGPFMVLFPGPWKNLAGLGDGTGACVLGGSGACVRGGSRRV